MDSIFLSAQTDDPMFMNISLRIFKILYKESLRICVKNILYKEDSLQIYNQSVQKRISIDKNLNKEEYEQRRI